MTDAELVKEAAEKVMGWTFPAPHTGPNKAASDITLWAGGQVYKENALWSPLANDSDSMMLVDKLVADGLTYIIKATPKQSSFTGWVEFRRGSGGACQPTEHAIAINGPVDRRRAIVMAALRATGTAMEQGGKG